MSTTPATPAPEAAPTRDSKGRFAAGNPGGPGNPYARLVAEHRRAIAQFMTPARREALLVSLYDSALAGDNAARKLLLGYMAGPAAPAVDPDRVAVDEWQKRKETAAMMQELPGLLQVPDPALPLSMVRTTQPGVTAHMRQTLGVMYTNPEQYQEELPELEMADEDDLPPPSPNGGNGPAGPSPNGDNGRRAVDRPLPNGHNGDDPEWLAVLAERSELRRRPAPKAKRQPPRHDG